MIYIVGPTASGKTALSVVLAKMMNAEVVCADSQTVRREMNIGTAKPTPGEMQGIEHHMIDVVDPYDQYSLADFQAEAKEIILDIKSKGKSVIIVGGSGLYVDSLYFDFKLPQLRNFAEKSNLEELDLVKLQKIIITRGLAMPKNQQNRRHLVNVLIRGGHMGVQSTPDPSSIIVGINPGRELLVERINHRVDEMFSNGLIDEVRSILDQFGPPPRDFDAIGYRIVMRYIRGEIDEEVAKDLFKIADRQYAKRQISWFKRNENIVWFESPELAKNYILNL
jgi:tRNA dimethylallyltransferase